VPARCVALRHAGQQTTRREKNTEAAGGQQGDCFPQAEATPKEAPNGLYFHMMRDLDAGIVPSLSAM